jgi:sugar phosphate isomerase/epimerase
VEISSLGQDDLVLSAGSLPRAGFRDRVAAAVAGGFSGISLWARQSERDKADGLDDVEMRAILVDNGLVVTEIEAVSDVLGTPATITSAGPREATCYRIADALGARSISLVEGAGPPLDVGLAARAFGAVCDRAAISGLLVHIEYWPGSRADLATAIAIVRKAARRNGGLLVDSWHTTRGPGSLAVLAAVTDVPIVAVQLTDGPLAQDGEYLDETMHRRLVPGDGEFDLDGIIRMLDARGSTAPLAVEVMSDALARLPAVEVGRRLGEATRAVVDHARGAR